MVWEDMVLVGRVARPHGLRGEVVVNPETDFAETRFRAGAHVWIRDEAGSRVLVIAAARQQGRHPVVAFEQVATVEDAETLAGHELRVPEDMLVPLADGVYYHHQLVGCSVETTGGERVGTVRRVVEGAGVAVLAIDGQRGEVLVPLAADICVEVDVSGGIIRIQPPDGLLELNETKRSSGRQ